MSETVQRADDLYGLAPSEFVAARDALVRRLRAEGDRAQATAVQQLRRPTATAAALNLAARAHPDLVEQVLDATQRLRKAIEGGDRDQVRAAMADERAATRRLLEVAEAHLGKGTTGAPPRLSATLRAATLDDALADELRRGVLTTDHDTSGFDLTGDLSATPARPTARGRARSQPDDDDAKERAAAAKRRRQLEAKIARLEATADRLAAKADAAEEAARSARAAAHQAASELEGAKADLEQML